MIVSSMCAVSTAMRVRSVLRAGFSFFNSVYPAYADTLKRLVKYECGVYVCAVLFIRARICACAVRAPHSLIRETRTRPHTRADTLSNQNEQTEHQYTNTSTQELHTKTRYKLAIHTRNRQMR